VFIQYFCWSLSSLPAVSLYWPRQFQNNKYTGIRGGGGGVENEILILLDTRIQNFFCFYWQPITACLFPFIATWDWPSTTYTVRCVCRDAAESVPVWCFFFMIPRPKLLWRKGRANLKSLRILDSDQQKHPRGSCASCRANKNHKYTYIFLLSNLPVNWHGEQDNICISGKLVY